MTSTIRIYRWILALTCCGLAVAAPPSPDYVLLYADEFDGAQVNPDDWTYRTGPRTGTGINGLNLARNVRLEDGNLVIVAKVEDIDGKIENTGGGVISRYRFGYGYYEVRSQPFMGGRGVHVAFWQRGLGQENNSLFEIDSYELDSTQKLACNNLYVSIAPKGMQELPWPHRANVPLALPPDGWWIDGYELTPDGVVFYDHGKVVALADLEGLVAAQNVWLTALNGVGRVDADKLPGETRFDYFRFYARDYPGANLLPNGDFEYNLDKVDLQKPLAWSEAGGVEASYVVPGDAALHSYKLRHDGGGSPYAVTTKQTLQYLLDGEYELIARVRRAGQHRVARIVVSELDRTVEVLEIPVSETWRELHLPRVTVRNNQVSIVIDSAGGAGDWLEVDDVRFMKPALPGQPRRTPRSFELDPQAPLWQLATRQPIAFTGDEKFYFFSRNLGQGDTMSISLMVEPESAANTFPITRMPKTGNAGWGIRLSATGDVAFRIGTHEKYREVVAVQAYRSGQPTWITCVYDRGEARLYIDGQLKQVAAGFPESPKDVTAPGRLGANSGVYEAVGDVTLLAATPGISTKGRYVNYRGKLSDVRIYNRVLAESEIPTSGADHSR